MWLNNTRIKKIENLKFKIMKLVSCVKNIKDILLNF